MCAKPPKAKGFRRHHSFDQASEEHPQFGRNTLIFWNLRRATEVWRRHANNTTQTT